MIHLRLFLGNLFWELIYNIKMTLGRLPADIFFKTFSAFLIITLPIIYQIAQKYKHEEKIAWISGCAQHYPEFLLFRLATITGSALATLGWLTNNFYLKTVSRQHSFHLQKYQPQVPMIMGIMGSIFLMVSTACLDTGYREGKLHNHCAAFFFVMSLFAIQYNSVLYWLVYNNTKGVDRTLLWIKTAIAIFLIIQVILTSKYGSYNELGEDQLSSDIGIILQWTGSFSIGFYYYVLSKDYKHFDFSYSLVPSQ